MHVESGRCAYLILKSGGGDAWRNCRWRSGFARCNRIGVASKPDRGFMCDDIMVGIIVCRRMHARCEISYPSPNGAHLIDGSGRTQDDF